MIDDQFDSWTALWEKAQKDGVFKDDRTPPKVTPQHAPEDFFGVHRPAADPGTVRDTDAEYWRQVYAVSHSMSDVPDPLAAAEMVYLHEQKKLQKQKDMEGEEDVTSRKKKKVDQGDSRSLESDIETLVAPEADDDDKEMTAKKAKDLGDSPNPVYPDSYGPDGLSHHKHTRVSAGLAADTRLEALHQMKLDLYELECQMSGPDGMNDKKIKGVSGKIKNIQQAIDDLSNDLQAKWATGHNH